MSEDIAIKAEKVNKTFKLPHEKQNSVKGMLLSSFKGRRTFEKQQVLKNISFDIKKGEFFGIVGRNGSGKSTLLKLLAGIYTPDSGLIQVNGKLTPFIELGVGFNPELTGRENVFLNGALLGFDRKEMLTMYDEIVEFAELEKFMDQKLKNYSSGMQVRLAFSIAIRANTEILVLDEVLAVGDAAFQNKCYKYFDDLKSKGKTVLLVTHDMGSVERFCDRALLIESGIIKNIGKPTSIAKQYTLDNINSASDAVNPDGSSKKLSKAISKLDIKLISSQSLKKEDKLEVEVEYRLKEKLDILLGISIIRNSQSVIEHNTSDISTNSSANKTHKLKYIYALENLNPGRYDVAIAIFERKDFKLIGFNTDSCSFIIEGTNRGGLLTKRGEWRSVTKK